MENIKMILCDIDGTLLNDEKKITPKTMAAISKLKERGILFGIATGRSPIAVQYLIKDWGLEPYVDILMGFNGSQYFDYVLHKEELSNLVDGKIIEDIIKEYSHFDISFGIFDGKEYHATRENRGSIGIATNNKLTLIIDDLKKYRQTKATKMLAMGEPKVIDEVEKYYQKHLDERYRGVRSTPDLFEFLEPHVSKSFGIERIAKQHGFTLENVCVFGDEANDLEMIRDCGVGVCMANGNPIVKEVADYITDSNNEDGVGKFIEDKILK